MGAFAKGDDAARKYLAGNPTASRADFEAKGQELASKAYKSASSKARQSFLDGWNQNGEYHVFCKDRARARSVACCLNDINRYHLAQRRAELNPNNRISPEDDNKMHKASEKAWNTLRAIGLRYENYYESNNRIWVYEI